MSTIKDVAREAGVSIATVSYVLSNDKRITKKTKDKVNEAIKKLNYLPSLAARSLKTNKLNMAIIILSSFSGPIYSTILDEMVSAFQRHNFNVLISSGENAFSFVESNQVEIAIVLDTSIKEEKMECLAKNGCIIADRRHIYTKEKTCEINYIDGYLPSKEVIDLAFSYGYKNIMYVHGSEDSIDDHERYQGYLDSHKEHGVDPFMVISGHFREDGGYEAIKKYIEDGNSLPEVIYSANDEMAIGIIKYLNKEEKIVPNKVKLIGYDDIELSSYISPSLTTIKVNRDDWAKYIAKEVLILAEEKDEEIMPFISTYEIERRETF